MKYSYNQLNKYHNFGKTPEELAELITNLGTEVESIKTYPEIDDKIIVAKILEVLEHPNADRLHIVKITTGSKELEIVCGAPNVEAGQLVPFAQVDAKIGDMKITEAEIRGVKSAGMLCSERELGLGENHDGIKILENVEVSEKVSKYLLQDTIFECEVTPNRGDLLSHFGLARDLAAYFGKILEKPELKIDESAQKATDFLQLEVKSERCPLYLARVIKGVKIAPSPSEIKDRLNAVGAKSINNVVDATNLVMFDYGQPLHAFDATKISGGKIIVREIENETEVVTLDGAARVILPGMLAICDASSPVAIAGIMGLKNSEVDDETTDIILEAAVFARPSIRKTAKALSLATEASYRYEREVDMQATRYALDVAAKMIQKLAGGEILSGVVESGEVEKMPEINIHRDKISTFAGQEFSNAQIDEVLVNLGFRVNGETLVVPSWRHDIRAWEDLTEEVIRMRGLEKIKPQAIDSSEKPAQSDFYKKEKIKDFLAELGLSEVQNYTFLSEADCRAAQTDPKNLIEVKNPVQEENKYLRNSLVPRMLRNVAKNPSFEPIEIFEIGNTFELEREWTSLGVVTSGKSARAAAKIVDEFCQKFGADKNAFKIYDIDRDELKNFKIKKPMVSVAEVDLTAILKNMAFDDLSLKISNESVKYREVSKFPPVNRDLAFVVARDTLPEQMEKVILDISKNAVLVELFDEFESDKFGENKKSVAFHIWLQKMDGTLADAEADAEILKITNELEEKFGALQRS